MSEEQANAYSGVQPRKIKVHYISEDEDNAVSKSAKRIPVLDAGEVLQILEVSKPVFSFESRAASLSQI